MPLLPLLEHLEKCGFLAAHLQVPWSSVQRLLREALERLDTASCCAAGEADARADGGTSGADAIALAEALSLDRHEPQEGAMSDCPRG